jgi:hypothetical protein
MAETTNGPKGAAAPVKGKRGGMNKMEAVRQALGQLGKHAKPMQIQANIKSRFGIEMSTDHISNYKSTILKGKGGKRKASKMHPVEVAAAKPAASVKGNSHLSLHDVDTVKHLLRRLGPHSLKGLIDVLAK